MKLNKERRFLGLPVWKWDGIAGACALLGVMVVAITAIAGVYQLNLRAEAARAEATLDILDVWETRGFLKDFQSLDRQVQSILLNVPEEDLEAARREKVIQSRLYERVSNEILASPVAVKKFEKVVYFFQRLHICVEAKLCAEAATGQFFDGPKESFARVFDAEIKRRRELVSDYATGLE